MDLEQRLRASLVPPRPGAMFTARVLARIGRNTTHRRSRFILIGTLLVVGAAAAMLPWRMPVVGASPVEVGVIPEDSDPEFPGGDPAAEPAAGRVAPTAAYGLSCLPAPATGTTAGRESSEQEEQRLAEAAAIRGRLLASGDPELLAAAALMATEPGERVALITQALARGGNSPLPVWTAARICAGKSGPDACPVDELSQRLLTLDPQNSETWMLAAVRRLKRGDDAGALDALQRAGAAADSRIYWAETIALLERAYAAASDYPFTRRALNAIGIAAANQPRYGDYSKMCTDRSRASPAWASACLAYGEQAERQSDTVMGVSIARGMQVAALKHLADPARLTAVLARQQQARAVPDGATMADEQLMISTPGLLARYLEVLGQQGEAAAMNWKRSEAARLRAELPACAAKAPGHESNSPP